MDTTDLTATQIWFRTPLLRLVGRLLPILILSVVTIVVVPLLLVVVVVGLTAAIVVIVVTLGCNVGSDREERGRSFGEELSFVIQQSFMNKSDCWGSVSAFNLICNRLEFFRQAFKYQFDLVFVLHRLTKASKIIKSCFQAVEIIVNGAAPFGPVLQLISQLFDMTSTWFRIGVVGKLVKQRSNVNKEAA